MEHPRNHRRSPSRSSGTAPADRTGPSAVATGPSPAVVGRRAHTVPVPPQVRAHRRAVVAWSLAHDHPVDRDALAAIVGHGPLGHRPAPDAPAPDVPAGGGTTGWTAEWIDDLLWSGLTTWCRTRGARFPHPDRVLSTLTTYIAFLSANRLLGHGSDGPAALRRAVARHRQERRRQERQRQARDRDRRNVLGDAAHRPSAPTSSRRPLATVSPISTPIV